MKGVMMKRVQLELELPRPKKVKPKKVKPKKRVIEIDLNNGNSKVREYDL